jgi:glycosyltransferase involved in cell wall biosynthesis
VVATAVGGVPECVENGVTGLLVPAADDGAAGAAAVAALLADPSRRRAMGGAARRRFAERYHIDAVAGRYLDFYRGVLARRRTAGAR